MFNLKLFEAMQKFNLRAAMGGIALTTIVSASLVTGNLTSYASKNIGQAEISIRDKDQNFLSSGAEQLVGWKIGNWKIVQAAENAAQAVANFVVGDPAQPKEREFPGSIAATDALAHLSEKEIKMQQLILEEELN